MPVPDELLDWLAEQYDRACIDSVRFPFMTWAAIKAQSLGYKL